MQALKQLIVNFTFTLPVKKILLSPMHILGNGSKYFFVYSKNLLKQQLIILKYFHLPHLQLSHKYCPKLSLVTETPRQHQKPHTVLSVSGWGESSA